MIEASGSHFRLRLPVFLALALGEIFFLTFLFDFDRVRVALSYWLNPMAYANILAMVGAVSLLLFAIVAWPRRREIIDAHAATSKPRELKYFVAANLVAFAGLLAAKRVLSQAETVTAFPLATYALVTLLTGAALICVLAPPRFWLEMLRRTPSEAAVAVGVACATVAAGALARHGWDFLSAATLSISHWFLSLSESNILLDTQNRILGVGDFRVQVNHPCSGYEGVALIVAFLAVYTWTFRRELRFPNVLVLFPIGVAIIWVLNALRIAVLVSIGAHISPAVALQGFHSAAGWIGFLCVSLACIAVSRRVPLFAARPAGEPKRAATQHGDAERRATTASPELLYLAPFIALAASSILASAFAPHDQWLYLVKVAAIGAVVWRFRDAYLPLVSGAALSSVAAGLIVGLAWIATDPGTASSSLGAWLGSLPIWIVLVWLCFRAVGSVALVPIAEELAFRGYLSRVLISRRFASVGFGEFRLLAFVGSSLAFGLMHERWMAACLAGAVYALLMYRTGRISDPIAAHMASNAIIIFYAVAMQQWSLL